MPARRTRQQSGTGLDGPSPSKHQKKIMRKLEARINGYEALGQSKTSKRGAAAYTRPGSQKLKKRT